MMAFCETRQGRYLRQQVLSPILTWQVKMVRPVILKTLAPFLHNGTGTLTITRQLTNTGSIEVNSGTLLLSGISTHPDTSTIAIANGATLEFSTVTHNLNGVTFTGTGTGIVKLSGGTLSLTGNVTFPALNMTGGTISGTSRPGYFG
jgi:autotransporter-associated beta strand protein